ncbi:MAG: hypothetical protein V7665_04380 [Parasphingorhabdus sp.]
MNEIGRNRLILVPYQSVTGRKRHELYDRLFAAQPLLCNKLNQRFTKIGLEKSSEAKIGKPPWDHFPANLRMNIRPVEFFLSCCTEIGDRIITQLIAGIS